MAPLVTRQPDRLVVLPLDVTDRTGVFATVRPRRRAAHAQFGNGSGPSAGEVALIGWRPDRLLS
jgi:hypothetical protein